MSLLRVSRSIACACSSYSHLVTRTIASSMVRHKNPEQDGFEGLQGGFVYDDKHGFSYSKDGDVVIITPDTTDKSKNDSGIRPDLIPQIRKLENDFAGSIETETFLNAARETYKSNTPTKK